MWFELVHSPWSDDDLSWMSSVAPVRLGYTPESLTYEDADVALVPCLGHRFEHVRRRTGVATHLSVVDESDVELVASSIGKPVLWTPFSAPRDICCAPAGPPSVHSIAFSGPIYAKRQHWLSESAATEWCVPNEPPRADTDVSIRFARIQQEIQTLARPDSFEETAVQACMGRLKQLRREAHVAWVEYLHCSPLVVNLPHYVRAWNARVYEGLAAGRPVVTWEIPGRPRNAELFQDGRDLVLYRQSPADLRRAVSGLLADPAAAHQIAEQGQRTLLDWHTCEHRAAQIFSWLADGTTPVYCDGEAVK